MRTKIFRLSNIPLLVEFILLAPVMVEAAETVPDLPKYEAKVKVLVSSSAEVKSEVESYIKRELRSLGDVVVSETDPDFTLSIIATENTTMNGQTIGYSFSIVVTVPFPKNRLRLVYADKLSPDEIERLTNLVGDYVAVEGHWLQGCGPSRVKETCQTIVAGFDTRHVEKARRNHESFATSFRDALRQKSPKPPSPPEKAQ